MRKNMTEIVFILDRSGSMSGLETDTIGGFNSMIEKQKKENGEALISTVLFDNVSEVIHDRVPVQKVEPMTDRDYSVRGCTALLDAIGGAIHHIGNVHKYARKEDVPEHTLFVITTDGMENASRRYDSEKVKKMIERQEEKYGWEKMVWFMAATALVTGLVQFIFFPNSALLGASGIVFMMIVLSSFTAARKGEIPVTLILVVIFYLGGEIMDGLFKQDNVSQIAHIVGGLCGLVFGFTVRRGRR